MWGVLLGAVVCGTIDAAGPAKIQVGLKHTPAALEKLEKRFYEVSDPKSPRYGQHMTSSQIADLVRRPDHGEVVRRAAEWMVSVGGVQSTLLVEGTDDAVSMTIHPESSLRQAEKAPPLPESLRDVVDYVVLLRRPLNEQPTHPLKNKRVQSGDAGMSPAAQKTAYGVPSNLKGTNKTNLQMVYGTGTFGYREEDLAMFYSTYATSCHTSDVSFDEANQWKGETGKNFVEGEVDTSYISAFAPGVKTLVVNSNVSAATEAGEAYGPALLAFLTSLNARTTVPYVFSMSLGSLSFGSCDKVCNALAAEGGHTYAECWKYLQSQFQACMFPSLAVENRIDVEFQKLGLRGTTVLTAAGDGGSHFAFGPFQEGLGSALNTIICDKMNMPVYPASSPYVLSVGGTQFQSDDIYGPSCSSTKPCAWESGGSGFGWTVGSAPYQGSIPSDYIKKANKVAPKFMAPASTYNGSSRGYPDVAALSAFGIPICTYGGCSGGGGTSFAAPTMAGMISLINDARLNAGMSPLGFVNTKLYQLMADASVYAECFTDVGIDEVGDLWDCNTFTSCTGCDNAGAGTGFVATKGWDAFTGFGQPKFAGLLKHFGP
eukprot:Hpha_TRINITY_DN23520_c0_g1::TRINITY_DN23520_c0_g1_i1::g.186524::m.186524/K01279/TPP1, CLN2; tripeptidyl-peptidase I